MVTVQNLQFSYVKEKEKVIKGIDFSISQGQIFGFLGPSGAGKTTVQRILIGLLPDYEGSVKIMGKERREWNRDLYEKIGVAFDFPNLYSKLTALENLDLIGSYYKQKGQPERLLEQVGLAESKNKKVETFSKGMKMRLNFIRSILHDPDILFFDEPTSGLDPINAKIIKEMIAELKNKGKTIFLTTHNMTVAEELCDVVSFIVDGHLPVTASPSALSQEYGDRLLHMEFIENGSFKKETFAIDHIKEADRPYYIMKHFEIQRIYTQKASLEEIFISITGRHLL